MKAYFPIVLCLAALASVPGPVPGQMDTSTTVAPAPEDSGAETIVAIRHGEKPPGGLGNLNCRGLNRALALPNVLLSKYGKPTFIFAPNPTEKVDGGKFYYVRPLITIEPTAIRCQLSVNTSYGYSQVGQLADELKKPEYQHALVFVAWEHALLDKFAQMMVKSYGGDPAQVLRGRATITTRSSFSRLRIRTATTRSLSVLITKGSTTWAIRVPKRLESYPPTGSCRFSCNNIRLPELL